MSDAFTDPRARDEAAAHARAWARAAGDLLLERFGSIDRTQVRTKSSRRDLVTRTDLDTERLIVERIRATYPEHAIRAEEETREDGELVWYVDPLDGTVNFVHGIPLFCVSIALYRGSEPLVGVVHAPVLDETFVAAQGRGATVNDQPLAVSDTAELLDAVVATGFPYRRGELANGNLGNFARLFPQVRGVRRMGSAALDLAFCAAGRIDAFWELYLGAHDLAAGALLVREAGGVVTDVDGGDAWLREGHLLAGPRQLVEQLAPSVHRRPEEPPFGPPFETPARG